MAKRTKRAIARKAKAPKKASKKAAKKAKTPKKHAAKRPVKTKAKRQKTSAKSGRSGAKSGAKKSASRRRRTPTQQETPQIETTIVDVIEEPVPGVFVVTEFVETNAEPEPTDSLNIDQTVGPEPEEQ